MRVSHCSDFMSKIFGKVVAYRTFGLLVVCLFSYGPMSVLSQGKRMHNCGIDEKGLGFSHACHTLSRPNLSPY